MEHFICRWVGSDLHVLLVILLVMTMTLDLLSAVGFCGFWVAHDKLSEAWKVYDCTCASLHSLQQENDTGIVPGVFLRKAQEYFLFVPPTT